MKNARKELESKVSKIESKIKCAKVYRERYYDEIYESSLLPLNYSKSDLENFYKSLDFEYDSGYGGQELYGTVWFEDGTWLSRGEYDGSEWWEYNKCPEIPIELEPYRLSIFSDRNTRLIPKEDAIHAFIKQSLNTVIENTNSSEQKFVVNNIKEIAETFFSFENVFLARTPGEYYYDINGNYIMEYPTQVYWYADENLVIESIKKYLSQGYNILLYAYYGIRNINRNEEESEKYKNDEYFVLRMIIKK